MLSRKRFVRSLNASWFALYLLTALLLPAVKPPTATANSASALTNSDSPPLAATSNVEAATTNPLIKGVPERSSDKQFSTEDFLPAEDSYQKKKDNEHEEKCNVNVIINVPHNLNAVNHFIAYPYPMAMPKPRLATTGRGELATDSKSLQAQVINSGYDAPESGMRPYPYLGWRWQYAYHHALNASHLDEPHSIAEMYPFAHNLLPYVRAECKRINIIEHDRQERYDRAQAEFEQNRSDAEADAIRKGYLPIEFKLNKLFQTHMNEAQLKLGEGTWWITGTHRVPGLIYYWQQQVEAVKGDTATCELTEDNALLIEGAW